MQIVELKVAKVLRRVKAKEVHIELEQSAKEFLIEKGYDPQYGARPMRRAVETLFGRSIRGGMLRGNVKGGALYNVGVNNGNLSLPLLLRLGRSGERELTATAVILSESRRIPPRYLKDPATDPLQDSSR